MTKTRRQRTNKRGGAGAANPSSYSDTSSYMLATVGKGNTQFNNVFDGAGASNNAIRGLQGQKAGKRRGSRKGNKSMKKGGFWGQIINQAIVPFSLLGLQQYYKPKKTAYTQSYKNKTRRNR